MSAIEQQKGEAARYRKDVLETANHNKKVEYINKWEVYREEKISLTAIFIKVLKKKNFVRRWIRNQKAGQIWAKIVENLRIRREFNRIKENRFRMRIKLLSHKMFIAKSLGYEGELDQELYNRTGRHVQVLRCDNGSEYDNTAVRAYCKENGITLQFCVPYRKGQNGHAERYNRTLTEGGLAQLSQSGLSYDFLFDSCLHYAFTRNRTPAGGNDPSFGIRSPDERYYATRQAPIQFLPFGCLVRPTTPPSLRVKHEVRTEEAILLGYRLMSKGGYLIYRPSTKTVVIRDEVNPEPDVFPGIVNAGDFVLNDDHEDEPLYLYNDDDIPFLYDTDLKEEPPLHSGENRGGESENNDHHNYYEKKQTHANSDVLARTNKTPSSEYIRARVTRLVGKTEQEALSTMVTDKNNKDTLYLKRDLKYDLKSFLKWIPTPVDNKDQKHDQDEEEDEDDDDDEHVPSPSGYAAIAVPQSNNPPVASEAIIISDDNPTWTQACRSASHKHWRQAAIQEIESHIKNNSFKVAPSAPGKKEVGSRWVLKIKRDANGKLLKYKARLVAKGFQQVEGVHYSET